jgi:hypothetical protein
MDKLRRNFELDRIGDAVKALVSSAIDETNKKLKKSPKPGASWKWTKSFVNHQIRECRQ